MPNFTQVVGVEKIMKDGKWYTLQDLRHKLATMEIYASECSVSARIRDLRKTQYGDRKVQSKPVEGRRIFKYRLVPLVK